MVFVEILVFIIGIVLLVKGADFFVEAASDMATKMGVSQLVVGLTIVAVGTSIPELAAGITAAAQGAPAIVIGNIVGSNIANIGLIAGISVLLAKAATHKRILLRDGYTMLFAAGLGYLLLIDGSIARWEGILMLVLYIAYLVFLLETRSQEDEREYHFTKFFTYFLTFRYMNTMVNHVNHAKKSGAKKHRALLRDLGVIVLSLAAIIFGAKYAIEQAIYFAELLSLPQSLIGVTLVALGTSLPELTVAVSAAKKGFGEIVIGNVIGSNIANILLIGGVSAIVAPIPVGLPTILFTAPFMIGISVLFLWFIRSKWEVNRWEGAVLLTLYVAFLVTLFFRPVWSG